METVAVVGLAKNVGKTTLLNYLIVHYKNSEKLGLVSIGVDGEKYDVWSRVKKPAIWAPRGTLLVTSETGIKNSSAELRLLDKIKASSLSPLYLAEVEEEGDVELIGVTMTEELKMIKKLFQKYSITIMLIDGAYNRLTNAQPDLIDKFYLVIGYTLAKNRASFWNTVRENLQRLFYPLYGGSDHSFLWENKNKFLIKTEENWQEIKESQIANYLSEKNITALYWPEALTNNLLLELLKRKSGFLIILPHGLKSFLAAVNVKRWEIIGGQIMVLNESKIAGIAYNPYHQDGSYFPRNELKRGIYTLLQQFNQTTIPIFDVVEDGLKGI